MEHQKTAQNLWNQQEAKLFSGIISTMDRFVKGELSEDKFIIASPGKNITNEQSIEYIMKCQEIVDDLTGHIAIIEAASTWFNYKFDRLKDLNLGSKGPFYELNEDGSIKLDENQKPILSKLSNIEQRKAYALSNKEVQGSGNAMIAANTLKVYLEKLRAAAQNRLVTAWNINKNIRPDIK